jgi:hypothetical protein
MTNPPSVTVLSQFPPPHVPFTQDVFLSVFQLTVTLQDLTAASKKMAASWDVAACSLLGIDRLHPDNEGSKHP